MSVEEARCVVLSILRPAWLESVEVQHGRVVVFASDTQAAHAALRGRTLVGGWPVEVREVTPR